MNVRRSPTADDSETHSSGGDASAWLAEHGDALYRYARTRVGNRELAEDLVQEAFLAGLQSQDRFQGRATVRTWLLSILRHKIVDHYRRAAEPTEASQAEPQGRADPILGRYFTAKGLWKAPLVSWKAPEKALEDREFWDVIDGCLRRLPASLSEVFILRELEDLEAAELRRMLDLSEGNLRVRLHRARLLLRECLEKHGFGEMPGGSRRSP